MWGNIRNYKLYRSIRIKHNASVVKVPKFHLTGPLISRRFISIICHEEQKATALRKNDKIRTQIGRERRDLAEEASRKKGSKAIRITLSINDGTADNSSHPQCLGRRKIIHQGPIYKEGVAHRSPQSDPVQEPPQHQRLNMEHNVNQQQDFTKSLVHQADFMPNSRPIMNGGEGARSLHFIGLQPGAPSFAGTPALITGNGGASKNSQ